MTRDAEEIRSYTLPTAGRSVGGGISSPTPNDIAIGQFEMLREIAAQLAILNENMRAKESSKPAAAKVSISSAARRTSNGKLFYVGTPWQMAAKEDMLRSSAFAPHEGFKELEDLELNETTEGRLGTLPTVKITRRQ